MRSQLKKTLKKIIIANPNIFFRNNFFKKISNNNFFSFCYHDVTDEPSEFQKKYDLFIYEDIFEFQLSYLKKIFNQKKKILNQSFLITFDDGYKGSFNLGLEICKKKNIKPLYFLNMSSIINQKPILSAHVLYLTSNSKKFENFCNVKKINKPYYLNIDPSTFNEFINEFNQDLYKINNYQGQLVNLEFLEKYQNSSDFFIGSHLYDHYNCLALNENQLIEFYQNNELHLKKFKNYYNSFAFPNGQPKLCFNKKTIRLIKNEKANLLFSSFGSIYNHDKLYDRIVLTNSDNTEEKINFKILYSYFRNIIYKKNLN